MIHPRSLSKNKLTELDDLAQQERLRKMLNIRTDEEQEPQTEPIMTIYKEGCNTTYSDVIEAKKPKKGFNKPAFESVGK